MTTLQMIDLCFIGMGTTVFCGIPNQNLTLRHYLVNLTALRVNCFSLNR